MVLVTGNLQRGSGLANHILPLMIFARFSALLAYQADNQSHSDFKKWLWFAGISCFSFLN
jgi:hypothetical protein